jgi:hypothetical protein
MYTHGTLKTHVLQFRMFQILWNGTFSVPLPTRSSTDHFSLPSQQSLPHPILVNCRNGECHRLSMTMITSFPSTIRPHHISTTSSRATSISICPNSGLDTQQQRSQHNLTGHQVCLIWCHVMFSNRETLRTMYTPATGYAWAVKESYLPSQKSIVTCCSGYGRKWIIGWMSAVSQRADTQNTQDVRRKNNGEFLFPSVD